ncbi:MAG: Ig-like domain-containing protein [Gemmatimonadales bacterium]
MPIRRPPIRRLAGAAVVLLVGMACAGGDRTTGPPGPPPPTPTERIAPVGGTDQRAPAGTELPVGFTVLAADGQGQPVPGITVRWAVQAGGGSLSADSTVTGPDGRASVVLTLGGAGPQTVVATAPGLNAVSQQDREASFAATALPTGGPYLLVQVPIPPNYGIHDTFVRDGLAFVCAWNSGLMIYDVGNGIKGGSPSHPVPVSTIVTAGGQVHNAWWFHNPATGEKRYVFVGQEGPGQVGVRSSGDIHVVDVSDLENPREVASYHQSDVNGQTAGTHNFWMDEANQVLYAAYYNGGVVALDVSGTLSGSLTGRLLARFAPGAQPYVWGLQLYNGSIYASDMTGGFWQLQRNGSVITAVGGGNNVDDRWTSDLWVQGGYAYTGTWGSIPRNGALGDALKVWHLDAGGAPVLVDSVITANINTVSDVEVSANGKLLMFSAEGSSNDGFHFYGLADPAHPAFLAKYNVAQGVHTASLGYIGGRVYAFGAVNPGNPNLMILDVTELAQ